MRYVALLFLCSGCAANMMQRPNPVAQTGGPEMTFTIKNVDISTQGFYFAPNIIPALAPQFFTPTAQPQPVPVPVPTPEAIPGTNRGSEQPPIWLVRRAAAGDAGAIAVLKRWEETHAK